MLLIENELYLCSNCQEKITAHWELLIAPESKDKAIDLIYLMFLVGKKNTTNTLFVYFSIKTVTMDISDIYPNICWNIRYCSGFELNLHGIKLTHQSLWPLKREQTGPKSVVKQRRFQANKNRHIFGPEEFIPTTFHACAQASPYISVRSELLEHAVKSTKPVSRSYRHYQNPER